MGDIQIFVDNDPVRCVGADLEHGSAQQGTQDRVQTGQRPLFGQDVAQLRIDIVLAACDPKDDFLKQLQIGIGNVAIVERRRGTDTAVTDELADDGFRRVAGLFALEQRLNGCNAGNGPAAARRICGGASVTVMVSPGSRRGRCVRFPGMGFMSARIFENASTSRKSR